MEPIQNLKPLTSHSHYPSSKTLTQPSAGVAKALTVRYGLEFLEKVRRDRVEEDLEGSGTAHLVALIETDRDRLPIVLWALGQEEGPWTVRNIINDCKAMLNQLKMVSLAHRPRTANQAAGWVAKAHRTNSLLPKWLLKPPPHLCILLSIDWGSSFVNFADHE